MKRRQLIVGIGGVVAGTGAMVGSGAFSSVEAERVVTVETARDDNAYLRLTTGQERSDRSFLDKDGKIGFTFPGLRETRSDQFNTNDEKPEGLGEDSVYRFSGETNGNPLFRAENQGSRPIKVYGVPQDRENVPAVRVIHSETGTLLTKSERSKELLPGEGLPLGLEVDTRSIEARDTPYNTSVTIVAEATD